MRFNLEEILLILKNTPDVLELLLAKLSDELIMSNEGAETWSPYDVIGHLIHGEKTDWIPRIRHILAAKAAPFETFDRFAQFEASKGKSLDMLLLEFRTLRVANIITLEGMHIRAAQLPMKGMHPQLGEVSLEQLLTTWAVHDLTHINQITRVLSMQFKDNMGPWTEFFSLMKN